MIVDREVFCPQCADAGRQTFLMQVIVTDKALRRRLAYLTERLRVPGLTNRLLEHRDHAATARIKELEARVAELESKEAL